ncbi:hypothetical protein [Gilvibacter sp.]|uniref:hypothetical protein n=1 Tax=Gilvibacter sp. TaxID=2729997 RepID=UPI003F4A687C
MYAYDQGQFLPTLIPFKDKNGSISFKDQAINILSNAIMAISMQDPEAVYITYSANYSQTANIEKTYASGQWKTGVNGSNQASVMREMEDLMANDDKYKALQGKMKIAPITTIPKSTELADWKAEIQSDLDRIKACLDGSSIVFGWINQETDPLYAHAIDSPSGVIAHFPDEIHNQVQNTLSQFAKDYPSMPAPK